MKFLSFTTYNIEKMADIAKANDKLGKNPPKGYKILKAYACMANPFPGTVLARGDGVSVTLIECDSDEAMATATLEMTLAGATVNRIPVFELPTGDAHETIEKLKI